jgi:tRNA uridine 5-carboxymethylaminomethyl modification enzyme
VIGAGHAGCEAALAAARTGARVLVVTPALDRVGFMPCNPSIGGPGKSHLVAEIDALGGAMGEVADTTALQVRRLNTSKGPAVQATRAQVDKSLYALLMKERLECQDGVALAQDEAIGLATTGGRLSSVHLRARGEIRAGAAVITAGTFLRAAIVAGESRTEGARAGDRADVALSSSLVGLGLRTRRFKTGTPPRVDGRTVDFSRLEIQPGDTTPAWLSRAGSLGQIAPVMLPPIGLHLRHYAPDGWRPQLACYRIGTNPSIHELIQANLHRAPMFNGSIEGKGPRYCPSIEDKVARFGDKDEHPIFLEPEGWRTTEFYVQGMSTSLPFDVQIEALRLIPGLENVEASRFGYAVEYDALDPNELTSTLETKAIPGLFVAGQINGTSGYEEAAGQGLVAGLNACRHARGEPGVIMPRSSSYLGVMIDDLVTMPFDEPYRMLTARSEYRLTLRTSTADARLVELGSDWALLRVDRVQSVREDLSAVAEARAAFQAFRINPNSDDDRALIENNETPVGKPASLESLMRRPSMTLERLRVLLPDAVEPILARLPGRLHGVFEEEHKYAAFVERERKEAEKVAGLGERRLPETGGSIPGLRHEARQQLATHRPTTFGEAQRIPGITPADIAALLIQSSRVEAAGH